MANLGRGTDLAESAGYLLFVLYEEGRPNGGHALTEISPLQKTFNSSAIRSLMTEAGIQHGQVQDSIHFHFDLMCIPLASFFS